MKLKLWILVIILLSVSCEKEKNIFYQFGDKELMTKVQVDSVINMKNIKMQRKNLDMVFRKEIIDTVRDGNKIIYKYLIKGVSSGVNKNVNKYEKMIGKMLPEFSLKNLKGRLIHSSELIGKPTVINMWFTTCPPCIAEIPDLNKIKLANSNSEVQFIAITYESANKVNKFLETKQFNFQHIINAKDYCEKFTNQYPINIFVNKKGVINHIEGGMPMIYDAKEKKITDNVNPSNFIKALEDIKD